MMTSGQPTAYRDLLRIDGLAALTAATAFSRLASRMFSLAIVLYVLERFASPALAGWLSFAAVAPGLIVSPLAGAFLDRFGSVSGIAVDMAASAFFIVALLLFGLAGSDNPTVLFALVALFSLTNPLSRAGVRALFPRLVPPSSLDRVNGIDTAIYAVTDVIGPGLAGLLVAVAGGSLTLAVIALTFAAAAACTALLRHLPRPAPSGASLLAETWQGIRVVVTEPTLRGLAISYSFYQVTWGVLVVVVPVFAIQNFAPGSGSTVAGFMWAASGVAGGIGALVAGHLRVTGRERGVMALGMMVSALATWPVASAFGATGLVVALIVVGALGGPVDVGLLTLRQRRTDPRQLGRVLSVSMSLNVVGYPIGAALAGVAITHSLTATFVLGALASVIAAALALAIPKG